MKTNNGSINLDIIKSADTNSAWINTAIMQYQSALEKRIKELSLYENLLPEYVIRRNKRSSGLYSYYAVNTSTGEKKYINSDNQSLLESLSKKQYATQICSGLKKNLKACNYFLRLHENFDERTVLESYENRFQELVSDIALSNSLIKTYWESQNYPSKNTAFPENLIHDTLKGDKVRSKSEAVISDTLWDYGIPQLYEYPITNLNNRAVFYPDFTLLHRRTHKIIYWEHCGKMDNPTYADRFVKKVKEYNDMGVFPGKNLILTFETDTSVLTRKTIIESIQQYLL